MTSNAVNRPTNVKQKEADINQKLQLYGIFTGELHLSIISALSWPCHSSVAIAADVRFED